MPTPPPPALSGRRGQAARNDGAILDAAREVFLTDPKAPIAAVAERAGVGISALYRRYPGKEDLLRTLCHDGLRRYLTEAEAALAEPDPAAALRGFLERVVVADLHALTVNLAGTFTPTPQMDADAVRAAELSTALFERARPALREGLVVDDLTLVLEGCSAVRMPTPARTREIRLRYVEVLFTGLTTDPGRPLPGPPPDARELSWRWLDT
ncbi:TetR/AcrR family transcriptional regulator [Pseudonocardia humida]|uniref:TetR/AcrR family transcriptional regulator n=1 Tax=Pseudonocardia humida TaxID=2800819 RepID=A0ABT0ZWZ3_9PSEU|nr:TetR/AcrR family transcriptional regulator [Pseudonocardia humida]MCO1655272.1 TetR/AcrR family transcriptional regulator [Pseudonocardia humida]